MSKVQNEYVACDKRMLFLLRGLHDVKGANKSALYRNASEKGTLDALIERNFIAEVPTPFSNKRTCVITQRGRVLYDALSAINEIWSSEPDSEIIIRVSSARNIGDAVTSSTETPRRAKNDTTDVSEDLEDAEVPVTASVDDSAFLNGKLYDAKGQIVAERIDSEVRQQTFDDVVDAEAPVQNDDSQEESE